MPNFTLEREIQQHDAIMALDEEGKTAAQIVKALFHGKTVRFAGVRPVADKNAAMARYIRGLGQSHPLRWKRFGVGSERNFFSKDSGLKSWEDVFQMVDAVTDAVGFALVPTEDALKKLPQGVGTTSPGAIGDVEGGEK